MPRASRIGCFHRGSGSCAAHHAGSPGLAMNDSIIGASGDGCALPGGVCGGPILIARPAERSRGGGPGAPGRREQPGGRTRRLREGHTSLHAAATMRGLRAGVPIAARCRRHRHGIVDTKLVGPGRPALAGSLWHRLSTSALEGVRVDSRVKVRTAHATAKDGLGRRPLPHAGALLWLGGSGDRAPRARHRRLRLGNRRTTSRWRVTSRA